MTEEAERDAVRDGARSLAPGLDTNGDAQNLADAVCPGCSRPLFAEPWWRDERWTASGVTDVRCDNCDALVHIAWSTPAPVVESVGLVENERP